MATRRKKHVQLGSTQRSHAEREKRFRTRIGYAIELIGEELDRGNCMTAFETVQNANVWRGLIESEYQAKTPAKKYSFHVDRMMQRELEQQLEPVIDRFKFQCLVGGSFLGLKKRGRR